MRSRHFLCENLIESRVAASFDSLAMQRFLFVLLALVSGTALQAADANVANAVTNTPAIRTNTPPPPTQRFTLEDEDRVVFLGDTFIEREQLESYIETVLTLRFPEKKVIFRNIGWSADTLLGESRAAF